MKRRKVTACAMAALMAMGLVGTVMPVYAKSNLKNVSLIAYELNDIIFYEINDKQFESLRFSPYLIEDMRGKFEAVEDGQNN